MEAWRRHYRPIPIGRRLMVLPAWMESEDANRIAIKIDPGMAFGTGTHPITLLCLELIEQFLDSARPHVVRPQSLSASALIDVGCGSGILSIAALKLGVRSALGVDIDPDAIRNARENASINGVGEALELAVGSVGEVLDGAFGLKSAPLVVANILAPVIVHLLGQGLTRLLEPGGCIILSGILKSQTEDVEEAARSAGLSIGERLHSGDWVALSASL